MHQNYKGLDKILVFFCCKNENVLSRFFMSNWYIITIREDLRGGINENIKGKGI